MKRIDQIKLNEVASKIQVLIFDIEGDLVESCDTLIKVDPTQKVYDQFIFLESLAEIFPTLEIDEKLDFPEVEWTEQRKALFSLSFQKISIDKVQLVILDKTPDYERLLGIQQSRNDSAINEEVALLQKRVAEVENQLLEFQNLELKRIQDFKNEFFAKVSHEMRTPLSSISGLVSLIEVNKQKINQYLPALRSTSQHLNSIVNDILDDAKIEAGKLDFESLDFDLKLEIENVLSGFQFESQQKAVKLHLDFPSQISFLKSDPIRIKQILYNLIGNSLKFTEKGHVSLEIQLITEEEDHVNLNFKISDSGIGMTHDQIVKVLEPYAQAGANTSRQYGGTGLGMGIAIKLIEAFGGKLNMKSQVGIGTEMSFQLKLLKGVNSEMASSVETSLKGLNIILAEDDPVNRAILTEVLNARDVKLTVVKSGKELSKALLNVDFDLVISDVELEDKSGIEALIDFRKSGKQTPFLFISGDNLERHSSLNDQFNWQWLQKPIELNALLNCINAVISQSEFTIDLSLLEKTVGGDKDFMKELLNTISTTLPKEINALKEAVNIRDVSETRRILHKIRPSIDYLGIPELSEWRKNLHDSELTESVSDYVISCNIFSNHVLKSVFQLSYYK